ncbi:hypothetical protein FRC98_07880 [Lujinxingia vulgaris]|uniref:Outer membrane protein beta-barrel domain-containing protein n=1 Tax=Lujinxingia vulgaris TaxID=2600176 RepID=A0A5C6XJ30_9DELT|nr:hypothetical protein [Lujinxingia vulgaris]TXD37599.1 hypothetical protein FRC98_07880 [Lujinxingia vulgaris]
MLEPRSKPRSSSPTLALLLTIIAWGLTTLPTPDEAHAWEGQLWAGAGLNNTLAPAPSALGRWGPGLQLGANLQLGDFWKVGVDLSASYHPAQVEGEDSFQSLVVSAAALEARYALDVFTYIPYVGLAGVFYPTGPTSERAPNGERLGLRATLGADYRYSRTRSLGVAFDIHAPMTAPQNFPLYAGVRAYFAWHFRTF